MRRTVNEPLAFHLVGRQVRALKPLAVAASALPRKLVIEPGVYRVHGKTWNLAREGLYRFLLPGVGNHQRIVYRRDPIALLSGLAWISSHGDRDNGRSVDEWIKIARTGKLIVTCGAMARMGQTVCESVGLRARRVAARSLVTLNTYDNGHALLEVQLDGRWTLVDLDVKFLFTRDDRRLSLLEFSSASQRGDYDIEPLAAATGLAMGHFQGDGYDYGPFMETTFCTEAWLRRWYKRIMMVPVIPEGNARYYTGTPAQRRKFARMYADESQVGLTPEAFAQRFYPS
jgi:hypothetical protein